MIPMPSGVRVWIAAGHTDMRRGMQGLALQVQEQLKRDPRGGDLYIFRGRRGDLAKILWHDGVGLSLYAKRLDRGKFIWPSAKEGVVSISAGQMAYMLEGIDCGGPKVRAEGEGESAGQAKKIRLTPILGRLESRKLRFPSSHGSRSAPPDDVAALKATHIAERAKRLPLAHRRPSRDRLDELLPWNWRPQPQAIATLAA